MSLRSARFGLFVFLAALASLAFAPAVSAQDYEDPPPPANQGPGFLIISVEETFDTTEPGEYEDPASEGSQTIVVPVGTFSGGDAVADTTFTRAELAQLPLPYGYTPESLIGNQLTILGSFQTTVEGEEEIHLVTPVVSEIPAAVQRAIYNGTRDPGFSSLFQDGEGGDLFPTTVEIADFIWWVAENNEDTLDDASLADILTYAFETEDTVEAADLYSATIEAEGELFPHHPPEDDPPSPLFNYSFAVDEDGNVSFDACYPVDVDIKPGSDPNAINLKKKGKLPVAILGSDTFDVDDIADGEVYIGGVKADKCAKEDVNGDGYYDLICHWLVQDLIDVGVLNEYSTSLTVSAELDAGDPRGCVSGRDSVKIVNK